MRGWLVPGFCPTTMIRSAWWRSSSRPCPCRCRSSRSSAAPDDSWHMFEQSGRLFVPKRARQQLVQERGLVDWCGRRCRRPPRRAWPAPAARSAISGTRRPRRSARSASAPSAQDHRLGEPALLAEPVVGRARRARRRVRGEEVRRDPAQRRLLGDRLRAVLAELGGVPVVRGSGQAQPGQSKPSFWLTRSSVSAVRRTPICSTPRCERHRDAGDPRRPPLGLADVELRLVDVLPGRVAVHASYCAAGAPRASAPAVCQIAGRAKPTRDRCDGPQGVANGPCIRRPHLRRSR